MTETEKSQLIFSMLGIVTNMTQSKSHWSEVDI